MVDISNKSLALLLVAAIVVSLGGTLVSISKLKAIEGVTGFATTSDTGQAQLYVSSTLSITFTTNTVDWGVGYVNNTDQANTDYCYMDSEGGKTSNCINFTAVSSPLVLRNDGNQNVSLQIKVDSAAASWIGGTSPSFKWKLGQNETGSCDGTLSFTSYTEASTTDVSACTNYDYKDDQDSLTMDVNVTLPEDSNKGQLVATITATATG